MTNSAADLAPETASWGRRLLALVIDWMACTAITVLVLGADRWSGSNVSGFYTLGIFVVEAAVFTTLLGGSFGQLMTRLRVVRLDGGRLGPLPALARSAMIALVIPPLVFKPDGRGLHDLVAGSRVVPLHAG
ncbi:RDD family protein [Nocardioides cavernaquae]|nr:RDD family protein [Nocardioides cavernaquae]